MELLTIAVFKKSLKIARYKRKCINGVIGRKSVLLVEETGVLREKPLTCHNLDRLNGIIGPWGHTYTTTRRNKTVNVDKIKHIFIICYKYIHYIGTSNKISV